jgi:hypothetical protein
LASQPLSGKPGTGAAIVAKVGFISERCALFAADALDDPFCAVLAAASRHSVARANAENTNTITESLLNMKFSFLCRADGKLLPAKWRDLRSTILVDRTNRYFKRRARALGSIAHS